MQSFIRNRFALEISRDRSAAGSRWIPSLSLSLTPLSSLTSYLRTYTYIAICTHLYTQSRKASSAQPLIRWESVGRRRSLLFRWPWIMILYIWESIYIRAAAAVCKHAQVQPRLCAGMFSAPIELLLYRYMLCCMVCGYLTFVRCLLVGIYMRPCVSVHRRFGFIHAFCFRYVLRFSSNTGSVCTHFFFLVGEMWLSLQRFVFT